MIPAPQDSSAFRVTEFAKSQGDYFLRYEKPVTSTVDLADKAEQRSYELCGGGEFRYLAVLEEIEKAAPPNELADSREVLEIEVDCMADGQDE